MSLAWPVNENGRPMIMRASQVTVVVPCAKWAWRCVDWLAARQLVGDCDGLQELLEVDQPAGASRWRARTDWAAAPSCACAPAATGDGVPRAERTGG